MNLSFAENPDLTTLYIYLTSGCNCACRHCYFVPSDTTKGAPGKVLDPDCLRHAITQALPLGLRRLKWTGGEPTLHPAFKDLLQIQEDFGLKASLETNGLLLNECLVACMVKAGVDRVSVSVDGAHPATHDRIRGVTGGFYRTIQGLRFLTGAGYRPEMILTLQRDNIDEIDEYLAFAADLGAGAVKFNILQPSLRDAVLSEQGITLSVDELIRIAGYLNSRPAGGVDMSVTMDVPLAFRPLSKIVSGAQDGVCNILHVLGILPSGEYALCGAGQHISELAMGHVMNCPLIEVWQYNPVLQSLRAGLPQSLQGVCNDCLMKFACKGSCVAANYQVGGDLFAPNWFCQQAMDAGLFPSTRLANKC